MNIDFDLYPIHIHLCLYCMQGGSGSTDFLKYVFGLSMVGSKIMIDTYISSVFIGIVVNTSGNMYLSIYDRSTMNIWERRPGIVGSGVTVLCPYTRHINPCLVLVQTRKTLPDITEKLLTWT